jgi:hypothetical protein
MATRPAIFNWRQTEPQLILCAVRWYLRYSLSLHDVEELLEERGLEADHTTVWRWVQRYGPELEQRLRCHLRKCCNFCFQQLRPRATSPEGPSIKAPNKINQHFLFERP